MRKEGIEIQVEKIRPNLRLVFPSETLEELRRSVPMGGPLAPIQVWFDGEGFRIQEGEELWRAYKKLKFARVPALLVK